MPTRGTSAQPTPIAGNVTIFGNLNASLSGNVTLNPGPNQIGSVTIFGNLNASLSGNITLNPSPNYIGLVTNTPAKAWPDPGTYIGLATVNVSNATLFAVVNTGASNSNTTLNPSPNQIGSVTVSNFTSPNLGNVTLNPGPNQIGSVTVSNFIAPNTGNTTLNPSPNQIGSVTISNNPTIGPGANYIGLASVNIGGILPPLAIGTNYIGLATVTVGNVLNSLSTLLAGPNQIGSVTISNTPTLGTGTNYIGLITIDIGANKNVIPAGNVTLNPSPNQIGSVTVSNFTAPNVGNVTLNSGPNQIGSVTVSNNITLGASTNYIGLVSISGAVGFVGDVTLNPGPNQIGSVTISNNPTLGTGTNFIGFATVTTTNPGSSSGNTTLNPSPNQIGSVTISNNPTLGAGTNYVGLASVNIGGILPPLAIGTNYIGLATVIVSNNLNSLTTLLAGNNQIGSVTVSNFTAPNLGNVTLNPSPNQVGSVTISNNPTLGTGSNYVGLASVNIGGSLPALATGTNYIGLVSVSGNVAVSNFTAPNLGNVTLNPSPNQVGSVTISNNPTLGTGTNYVGLASVNIGGTLPPLATGANYIGLVTVGNTVTISGNVGFTGNTTLNPGPNQIGSVTIANNPTLGTGTNYIGLVTSILDTSNILSTTSKNALFVSTATGSLLNTNLTDRGGNALIVNPDGSINSNLKPGSNYIGLATVIISNATLFAVVNTGGSSGNTTLNPSPNQIGSVTISNNPTLGAGTNYVGLVSVNIGGTLPALATGSNYIGLASVNIGGTLPALMAGTAQIGSVTVSNFTAPNLGNITLNPGPNQIGSVTISNSPTLGVGTNYVGLVTAWVANTVGNATLNPSPNQIGSVTISNSPTLGVGTNYIGLATVVLDGSVVLNTTTKNALFVSTATGNLLNVNIGGRGGTVMTVNSDGSLNNLLLPSPSFIGLVTMYPGRSMTTSLATMVSASGAVTIFVPPTGKRFFIHNLMINAQGNAAGQIQSEGNSIWPFAGLATYGGFSVNFADPGLPGTAINQSFVVNLNSAATISVGVTAHFE